MKKVFLILSAFFVFTASKAQLGNTKWKGTLETDTKINVVFEYGADTLKVNRAEDGENIETMTYTVKDSIITVKKVSGISDCNASGPGKYSFQIKDDNLLIKLVSDACDNRSGVLNNSKYTKVK